MKAANITSVFKKDKKEDLGSYRLVSLISIPGKVMEQIILKKNPNILRIRRGQKKSLWIYEKEIISDHSHSLLQ